MKSKLFVFCVLSAGLFACNKTEPLNPESPMSSSGLMEVQETSVSDNSNVGTMENDEDENREGGKKYDKFACTVYDGSGEVVCAGQRCGVPNGSDCNSAGACQCIERSNDVFMGYSVEEFNALLRDPQGWTYLQSMGVYIVDGEI